MKIAMIQKNYTIADFTGNIEKMKSAIEANKNADMIVFSELCVSGYYPWDLMSRHSFQNRQENALNEIAEMSKNVNAHIVIGAVRANTTGVGKPYFNSMLVYHKGKVVFDYDKKLLPTYNIFDEKRHFEEGVKSGLAELNIGGQHRRIGFMICEDGWNDESYDYITNPVKEVAAEGATIFISINASPSNIGKPQQRDYIFGKIAKRYGIPFVYVNQVGANDEIVFDGGSFVFDGNGEKQVQMPFFEEAEYVFDTTSKVINVEPTPSRYEFIFKQIGLGLKDYLSKQGMKTVVFGSSGGVDSAAVAAMCKLHLGAENVKAITMPSKYSSTGSVDDSVDLCNRLGIELFTLPIVGAVEAINEDFKKGIGVDLTGVSGENVQARVRDVYLMAYSNQLGNLMISTGNKSENSVGYYTLFDACGLNILGDLYKTEVFELCEWINKTYGEIIPVKIITKMPSAELSPGQSDEKSLMPYKYLDAILKQELEWEYFTKDEQEEIQSLIDEIEPKEHARMLKLLDRAEFKRQQSGVIIRVHPRAFGNGRKVPIVHKC